MVLAHFSYTMVEALHILVEQIRLRALFLPLLHLLVMSLKAGIQPLLVVARF